MSEPVGTKIAVPRETWKVAVLAGMASYLDAGCIVTSGGALVLYKNEFDLGAGDIGALSSILTFLFAIGALIGGRLGDRFGRRKVFTVTMIGLAVGTAIMAGATGTAMLYVGTVLVGFSIGADLPVSMAMISEEAPEGAKGRMVAFSNVLWMLAIGTTLGLQAIVGGMGTTGGRIMWLHPAILAVVVLVLRTRMPESKEWAKAHTDEARGAMTDPSGTDLAGAKQLVRKPFVFPLVALALFYGIVNLSANTGGQFSTLMYTELAGVSVSQAGLIGLGVLVISFLSALGFMRVIDRPSRMSFFLIGGIIYTVAQATPLVFGIHAWTLIVWQALGGIGGAFAGEPMWKIWSQELFPTLLRTSAQGVTVFFTRVLAALAAGVTPLIVETSPRLLFVFLTACVAFTTALAWFWIRRMPKGQGVEDAMVAGASPDAAFVLR